MRLEGAFYIVAFMLALRGEEVSLIESRGIRKYWEQEVNHPKPQVFITLLGQFKNEIGETYHSMPVLAQTPRSLQPLKWVDRFIKEYERKGIVLGYMFHNQDGSHVKGKFMDERFHERLLQIQDIRRYLILEGTDVIKEYGTSRSFRRGGTSEATNQGAPPQVIELNGWWRKSMQSGASHLNITIREHYMDIRLVMDQLLEFSRFL
jgi:hypothetical protein